MSAPRNRSTSSATAAAASRASCVACGSCLPSLRANGSRECAPDDRLREAIHKAATEEWIASSLALLAMTIHSRPAHTRLRPHAEKLVLTHPPPHPLQNFNKTSRL